METEVTAPEGATQEASATAPELQTATAPTAPAAAQELGTGASDSSTGQQLFTVKVDGEEIQVPLEEALSGYQRQADYTRKTQELAEQRQELTFAQRIQQGLEEDPARTIQALVTAYGVDGLGALTPQAAAAQAAPQEPLDPEDARFARVEQFIASQEMRAFEAQVQADLSVMHSQFGEFNDQEVIQYAVEHGIPDVKEATKAFVVDRVLGSAQRTAAERRALAAKNAAPPVAGGHGVAAGTVTDGGTKPVSSIGDAFALAKAAHPGIQL